MSKFDDRLIGLADYISQWSKDPSSKVGAVIADDRGVVRGLGYNGLPRGIDDDPALLTDRDRKLAITVHAEVNAILNAATTVYGCTAYATHQPCGQCAAKLINAGVARVVYRANPDFDQRWGHTGANLLRAAGVEVVAV